MIEQFIDTNVLLFFLQNDRRLPGLAADLIEDANRISLVSIACLWGNINQDKFGQVAVSQCQLSRLPQATGKAGL